MHKDSASEVEKTLAEHNRRKIDLAEKIVSLLKKEEKGLTFEKAEKILLDTIDVLQRMSKRQEIQ